MTVKHFGGLSRVVSVTKRFRVIAGRFENDRQAVSSDRRGYARVSLSCPHYLFKKRANGSCRRFFILYLSHLCLCTLKIRVRNAPRRFFLSFFAEKGSATEKSSTAGKFDRVGSNYKIIL